MNNKKEYNNMKKVSDDIIKGKMENKYGFI